MTMLLPLLLALLATASAQSTNATQLQIPVYPPFPIRSDTNMQHTQRAYGVSLITAISSTTLIYAISCSPLTTMTRFNDVCGTAYVPDVITVTQGPDAWQWTAQGKTLYCTHLSAKTKTCTSVTNSLGSDFAPVEGTTQAPDFLPGFLGYFTTMTPVLVDVTAGTGNVDSKVLASLVDDATGLVTIQTASGTATEASASSTTSEASASGTTSEASASGTVSEAPASTGAAPRVTGVVGREMLFGAFGAVGAGVFGL